MLQIVTDNIKDSVGWNFKDKPTIKYEDFKEMYEINLERDILPLLKGVK